MKSWSPQQIKQYLPIAETFQRLLGSSIWHRLKPKCERGCDACNPTKEMRQQNRKRSRVLTWSVRTCLSWSSWCLHERRHIVWWEDQGLASKIFPQRFSRRKSLCSSYVCAFCTLPSSQFSGNKRCAGSALTTTDGCLTQAQPVQAQGNKPGRGEPPVKAWLPWRTASSWATTQELLGKVILSWCSWENVGLFADRLSEYARLLTSNTWADCNFVGVFLFYF